MNKPKKTSCLFPVINPENDDMLDYLVDQYPAYQIIYELALRINDMDIMALCCRKNMQ
jgi:hypothetical protein